MVVCGEGDEVFLVPTKRGQRKPKRPTHKDPREEKKKKKKPNKGILLMVLNNGGARFPWTWTYEVPMDVRAGLTRGSFGWRTRDPWMTC